MTRVLMIRREYFARARQLGRGIAQLDRIIRPRIEKVQQYENYHRFRIAHRSWWEHSGYFEATYLERLYQMADKIASENGLSEYDSIINWELWYNRILNPIKDALWETWERETGLERRYLEARVMLGVNDTVAIDQLLQGSASDVPDLAEPEVHPQRRAVGGWLAWLGWNRAAPTA